MRSNVDGAPVPAIRVEKDPSDAWIGVSPSASVNDRSIVDDDDIVGTIGTGHEVLQAHLEVALRLIVNYDGQ
jgi:hypothetical protein